MAQIKLDNIGLTFHVRRHGRMSLKEYLVRGMFRRSQQHWMAVHSLRGISLKIEKGERIGIVGHNGAGKSSLLRVMAGVYPVTSGTMQVQGNIASLFDLTLGFEPDASGWENIIYRGYLQGETPTSIRAKMDAIAEFSELGDFLNMPVRYYSAGMIVRLGFSIATAVSPQILIIDEVLSAGDRAFQERAQERVESLVNEAAIVVVVSHDMLALAKLCSRILWLDRGRIIRDGPAEEVIEDYSQFMAPLPAAAA